MVTITITSVIIESQSSRKDHNFMLNERASSVPLSSTLKQFGQRMERYRISRNVTQDDLAKAAGLARMTVSKLESGKGATLETVLRVLRAYGLEDKLLQLVPDATMSPLDPRSGQGKPRQRVRPQEAEPEEEPWSWGDEPGSQPE